LSRAAPRSSLPGPWFQIGERENLMNPEDEIENGQGLGIERTVHENGKIRFIL